MTTTGDTSPDAFYRHLLGTKSKATARKYAPYVRTFLRLMRANGYETFAELPPGLLGDFVVMLSEQEKSPATIKVEVAAVKKYLEWVKSRGVTVADQAKVDLPKQVIQMRTCLPTSKFTDYFRHADMDLEEPVRTAVMLLPCCGLRISELINLRLGSIHAARVKMKTPEGKEQRYKDTLYLKVLGKGGKERYVPLMEEGVEILTGYLAGWRRSQKGFWLFPSTAPSRKNAGKHHVSDRYIRGAMQKMREPMGLTFTPHTMRRTYITMLWRKGIDLGVLARIAGHKNVQTTLDHYINMEPDDVMKAFHNVGGSLTEE